MKNLFIILFIVTATLNFSKSFENERGSVGVGVILGEPTGLSGKFWLNEFEAIDAGVAYSFFGESSFSLHADYLYHDLDMIIDEHEIPVYYGFGFRYRALENDAGFGARGVMGVLWYHPEVPVDIFFEIVPVFELFPATSLNLDIAIGGRFYFK